MCVRSRGQEYPLKKEMRDAARHLDFERAAELRDMMMELKAEN